MAVIATAEVRVIADTSRFTEDLRRKLRSALNSLGEDFSRSLTQSLSGLGEEIGRIINREVRQARPQVERSIDNLGSDVGAKFNDSFQSAIERNANYDQFFSRLFHNTISDAIEEEAREASKAFEREFDLEEAAFRKAVAAADAMDKAFEQQFAKNFDKHQRTFETEFDLEEAAFRKALATADAMDRAFEQQFAKNFERRGEQAAEALQQGMQRKLDFEKMTQNWSRQMVNQRQFARAGRLNAEAFEQRFGALITPAARRLSLVFSQGFFPSSSPSAQRSAQRFVDNLLSDVERQTQTRATRIGNLIRTQIGGSSSVASRAVRSLGQTLRRLVTGATLGPLQRLGTLFSDFSQEMATSGATALVFIGVLIQLTGLLGALPATLSVVAAGVTAAAFAFRGMGDAFSAALGDAEAFEEAIEDLAPAAQNVVREFRAFRGAFSNLRLDAQQALWSELEGAITRVGNNLGGALREGIIAASGAMGRLIDGIADFLSESATADTVAATFDALTGVLDAAADEMQPLLRGMREIVDEFLPRFEDLEDVIDGIGTRFEEWATAITTPREELGGLSSAMDAFNRAVEFIAQFSRIIRNVFRTVGAIFSATADNGVNLLGTIEALTNNLAEMAESAAGQEALGEFFDNLDRIIAQLLPLIGTLLSELGKLAGPIADLIEEVRPDIERFFRGIGDGIRELLEQGGSDFLVELFDSLADIDWDQLGRAIGNTLRFLAPALTFLQGFINLIVDIANGIGTLLGWIDTAGTFLENLFNDISDGAYEFRDWWEEFWLVTVPQAVWSGLQWVGEAIVDGLAGLLDILLGWVESIRNAWNELWDGLGLDLGLSFESLTSQTDLSLSGLTSIFDGWGEGTSGWWDGLLSGLGSRLSGAFGDLESTVSGGTSGLSSIFTGWGSGISSWWSGLWSGIRGSLSSAWKSITSTVSSGVSGVREAVSNLAGFFRSTFNGIVSTVSSAASSVSGYLSDIRSAVSSITNLTSGLSGFSFFADGGIVFGPTRAIVGEAGPEVIIPLTRPERAATLAADSGLLAILAAQAGGAATTPVSPASIPNVEMHVHSGVADAEQVARRAVRLMERRMGPRGLERI